MSILIVAAGKTIIIIEVNVSLYVGLAQEGWQLLSVGTICGSLV